MRGGLRGWCGREEGRVGPAPVRSRSRRAARAARAGRLPVEQRGVDVQVLHGHLHAPVGVARGRHSAGRAAAEEAQVGELVRGHGGQRAADGLGAHGSGHRASGPRCPLAAPAPPQLPAGPPAAGGC